MGDRCYEQAANFNEVTHLAMPPSRPAIKRFPLGLWAALIACALFAIALALRVVIDGSYLLDLALNELR